MFCSNQFHTGWPNFNIPLMYMYGYKSCLYKHVYVLYIYCITGIYIYIYRYSVLIYFYMFIYMVYIYIYTVTSLEWWFVSELIPKWLHVLAIFNLWMIIIQPSILYIYIYTHYIYGKCLGLPGTATTTGNASSSSSSSSSNPHWRSSMNVLVEV